MYSQNHSLIRPAQLSGNRRDQPLERTSVRCLSKRFAKCDIWETKVWRSSPQSLMTCPTDAGGLRLTFWWMARKSVELIAANKMEHRNTKISAETLIVDYMYILIVSIFSIRQNVIRKPSTCWIGLFIIYAVDCQTRSTIIFKLKLNNSRCL